MAITTYEGLKSAVATWMARDDLTAYVPDFITFAEGYINTRLRHRKMVTTVSLTPVDGVCTLPTDYLQYRRVVVDTGTRYTLEYIVPDQADQRYPSAPAGLPIHFTIVGDELRMFPTTGESIELTYWQQVPALSATNSSNWLLAYRSEAYLRLACSYAADFIKNDGEAQKQLALADMIFEQIERDDTLANYSRAGMTFRGVTP